MNKSELLVKYEVEVEEFLSLKQMDDEILFQAIVENSKLICGYASNVGHFAEQGELIAIENSMSELRMAMNSLNAMVKEAKERARQNES